jgi:anti-sigma factor RsiW
MNQRPDQELSAAIKTHATRHAAPAALRAHIESRLRQTAAPPASAPRRQWLQMGAAFACGVIVSAAAVVLLPRIGAPDPLPQEITASHVRSLMASHLEDVASSDQHTVKPWFSGKLDYSPPVRDLARQGYPLAGARLDYIDRRPVAARVYRHQAHTINLFVWPGGGVATGIGAMTERGYNIAHWRDRTMQFWAVSDLNPAELHAFAEALRGSAE